MNVLVPDKLDVIHFEDFIAWYPEQSETCYELHQGAIVAMPKPKGKHSEIAGFLIAELNFEIRRLGLSYVIPRECIVKCDDFSGYEPDVIVLDRNKLGSEPRWEAESTITQGETVPIVIEVVSSNWSDDYALKLDAYETLGIQEYWIVDYLGIGGRKFIGSPKQPTLSVYHLENGEYAVKQYKKDQLMESLIFPEIRLSVSEIFTAC
ncbi:MAG: Uma2 family endonuclease [Prochlorothrix sp.]|nr:Uma2 family endonuclease [Prochlorothrix sp.]